MSMKKPHLTLAMTALMLPLASFMLLTVGELYAAEVFTRVSEGPGSGVGNTRGAAWGDYDNDGFIDLFAATAGGKHFLYHNNTNGSFSRVTNGPVAEVSSVGRGAAWSDYDNDGYLDLYLGNSEQANKLFRNNGAGSFAAVNASIVTDSVGVPGVTWVDYDSDGYVDLFRTALFNPLQRLHRNRGNGTFTQITQGAFLTAQGIYVSAAWGDFNNDGRPDIFLPNVTGPNYLYRNNGGGSFTRVGAPVLNGNSNAASAAWGDYDNDGDLDLFVTCAANTGQESWPNLFYRNDGSNNFIRITSLPANDPENKGGASMGCSWGDYDNDGWLDLFVANRSGQNDFLYHNNGDGTFTKVLDSVAVKDAAASWAVAWGDYDNDGFLDLFVGNFEGTNFLYHNNTNDNQWLKFRLIGTQSNRAAIGAKVRVSSTINGRTFWQMREVFGGDGTMGQNSLHVHIGLGNATNAALVRIEWPSGTVQELRDVRAKQFLTVTEPARLESSITMTNEMVGLKIKSWKGFVYDIEASNDLNNWTRQTTITNEAGLISFEDPLAGEAEQRFYRAVGK